MPDMTYEPYRIAEVFGRTAAGIPITRGAAFVVGERPAG
jgi:hypothetical protein